jgi:polysaccharide deacetylase family protein (PEP-CTERM system associated)
MLPSPRVQAPLMPAEQAGAPRSHVLTVGMEDYFQVGAFNRLIQRGRWYRFEARVENGTRKTLDLLDEFGVRATFFVLGWVAEQLPELVREVAARGHEVASKGYYHRNIRQLTPGEFRDDLARSREVIEAASGQRVMGFRVADQWFEPADLWALDVLANDGYAYDSSIGPMLRAYASEPWRRFAHRHRSGEKSLWEFPISTASVGGFLVPIAGGNYFRQFPHWMVRHAVRYWHSTYLSPFVMYFHTWEMDPEQPRIDAAPLHTRVRHYRNLDRMPGILRDYFGEYRFSGIADHLGLAATPVAPGKPVRLWQSEREQHPQIRVDVPRDRATMPRVPVTMVVPCYNEERALPYLANTLRSVEDELGSAYDLKFVFVDDRSSDDTWQTLQKTFGDRANCTLVRHDRNRGVAAGIMTGILSAETEIVCSIDCDCTYDPHEMRQMIPLLEEDVDLVVASPYHPDGGVRNVPEWRLFLSRGASALYRRILRQKLYTYTSCFRVYRRSRLARLDVKHPGFLGVAEIVGKLDLTGSRIVEYPTTLEVRVLGRSKMKVLRTIFGHIRLLAELTRLRLMGGFPARAEKSGIGVTSVLIGLDPGVLELLIAII